MYFQNPKCQCIIAFLLISIRTWGKFWIIFGNVESSSICSTLIVDWLSNWTCNRMHRINSLITNFLNLIIYNLQSPICTFSNIIYKICETKDGVILVSKSAKLSYGQNQWLCTWVGLCCAKKTLVKSVKTLLSNCKYREISENWPLQLFL